MLYFLILIISSGIIFFVHSNIDITINMMNYFFITLLYYAAILYIAVGIAYAFFISSYFLYQQISFVGNYNKFNKNDSKARRRYFWSIFRSNIILTIPVFISIYVYLQPKSFEAIYSFFMTNLIVCVAFFSSLRFSANPTMPIFNLFRKQKQILLSHRQKKSIQRYKENIISFYFSITEVAIFLLIMQGLLYIMAILNGEMSIPNITLSNIPIDKLLQLIFAYILALFVSTISIESILERWEPINLT